MEANLLSVFVLIAATGLAVWAAPQVAHIPPPSGEPVFDGLVIEPVDASVPPLDFHTTSSTTTPASMVTTRPGTSSAPSTARPPWAVIQPDLSTKPPTFRPPGTTPPTFDWDFHPHPPETDPCPPVPGNGTASKPPRPGLDNLLIGIVRPFYSAFEGLLHGLFGRRQAAQADQQLIQTRC